MKNQEIDKSNQRATNFFDAVKKHLKDSGYGAIVSFGTKISAYDGCSNHAWVRIDLNDEPMLSCATQSNPLED